MSSEQIEFYPENNNFERMLAFATEMKLVGPPEAVAPDANPSRLHIRAEEERAAKDVITNVLENAIPGDNGELCLSDGEYFFVEPGETAVTVRLKEKVAKAICQNCTFKSKCLEIAFSRSDTIGIWGGTTEKERKAIKRRSKL